MYFSGYANGTAVCIYQETDIDKAFQGSFQEYDNGDWSEVPDNRVPRPRPGACTNDSRNLPSDTQYFIKSHPLMTDVVQQQTGQPLYHANNIFYSKLVVHKVFSQNTNMYYILFMVTGLYFWFASNSKDHRLSQLSMNRPLENSKKIQTCILFAGNYIHKVVIKGDIISDSSKMVAKWKISEKENIFVWTMAYSVSDTTSYTIFTIKSYWSSWPFLFRMVTCTWVQTMRCYKLTRISVITTTHVRTVSRTPSVAGTKWTAHAKLTALGMISYLHTLW